MHFFKLWNLVSRFINFKFFIWYIYELWVIWDKKWSCKELIRILLVVRPTNSYGQTSSGVYRPQLFGSNISKNYWNFNFMPDKFVTYLIFWFPYFEICFSLCIFNYLILVHVFLINLKFSLSKVIFTEIG